MTKKEFRQIFKDNIKRYTFRTGDVCISSQLYIHKKHTSFQYLNTELGTSMKQTIDYAWRYAKKNGNFKMGETVYYTE